MLKIKQWAGVFHLVLIIVAWSSPFWLDWRIVMMTAFLLVIQFLWLGGCVLLFVEIGKQPYATFYHHHLSKLFPQLPQYPIWFFMRFVAPILIPSLAYWWQVWEGSVATISLG